MLCFPAAKLCISPLFIFAFEWHRLKDTHTISHVVWVELDSLILFLKPG